MANTPPLPAGFVLDGAAPPQNPAVPPLPAGFQLDGAQPQGFGPVSDEMSLPDRMLAQYGRGVAELGGGLKQLALHAGSGLGLVDPSTVAKYDQSLKNDAELYDKDLGQRGGGSVLPAVAQMVTTLPVGGVEALAGKGVLSAAGNTALQGAALGALQQDTGDGSYAGQKLGDVGLGALVGGGTNLGLRALGSAVEAANPRNLAAKTLNYFNAKANQSPMASEGERLAAETGVDLTPGQVSGSKAMSQAENAARQSIFSRDIAFEGDRRRTQQLADYYTRTMDGISASGADPITVGQQARAATQNLVSSIEKDRSAAAAQDFGQVRALTKGGLTINPSTTADALNGLVSEYGGVGTPGGDAIAKFAQKQLSNVGMGGLTDADKAAIASIGQQNLNPTITAALDKQLPGFAQRLNQGAGSAPAEGNLDKLIQLRSYLSKVAGGQAKISGDPIDRKIGAQLLGTIDQDIDANAQAIGGDLGGALAKANARYKQFSQQIDSVKSSTLGKLMGDDFAGAAQSGQFNTIPPETVAARLYAMKPSEVATVKGLLANDPDTLAVIKRGYLEDALNKASQIPASEGANTPVMRPNILAKTLGDQAKLKALFEPNELSQINNALDTARRLSDKTGYNFSGTAGQNEVLSLLNNPLGAAKKVANDVLGFGAQAGTAGLGAKAVARLMTDANGRAQLMKWQSLPPQSAQARQIAAFLAANYAEQPEQGQ